MSAIVLICSKPAAAELFRGLALTGKYCSRARSPCNIRMKNTPISHRFRGLHARVVIRTARNVASLQIVRSRMSGIGHHHRV